VAPRPNLKKLEAIVATHDTQIRSLSARVYGSHTPKLKQHDSQIQSLTADLAEIRRTQHSLVEAIGRVLDRQTHDSLMIERLVKMNEQATRELSTFAGHLSKLAKVRK
jgi:vacuolar-type H+-ATPase subunit I/STV1